MPLNPKGLMSLEKDTKVLPKQQEVGHRFEPWEGDSTTNTQETFIANTLLPFVKYVFSFYAFMKIKDRKVSSTWKHGVCLFLSSLRSLPHLIDVLGTVVDQPHHEVEVDERPDVNSAPEVNTLKWGGRNSRLLKDVPGRIWSNQWWLDQIMCVTGF